ncbi:hypothetical protein LSH36_25g01011 [Paralvinella palmiformis]|uniref:RecF/RecN/SMC N-terminal domain-containing protein n=1 Tax=Paralvinella palmiformis TaxID=53620 RepID=A0AAD9KAC8_9ANNE|nr:hypothetical protein LSH36_25g01011 [Paralvinella palmiformis]
MPKRKLGSNDSAEDLPQKRKSYAKNDINSSSSSQESFSICDNAAKDEAEVGIIEQVMVKNFMCHTLQDIKFGPQVNFVTGRNGSGKSAILTAIVIGLGGKANITNRGNAIKSFIKIGKHSAEVMIKLRNHGKDAYRPEAYGKSIIIERKIAKESSSYKIKSCSGVLISTKREELCHILEHFNIQVENPIVILNQETSRNFLHSKSPQDKYKFFLKATQLEQMKRDYSCANESKEIALEILKQKKQTLPTLEKEVSEWEHKYKALTSLKNLQSRMEKLKDELIWALVSEQEKGIEPIMKELRLEEARTPKFHQKIKESEEKLHSKQECRSTIERELKTLGIHVESIEPQYREARVLKDKKKKLTKAASHEVKKIQNDVETMERDKQSILARITEIQNSAQQDFEAENKARTMKILQLEEQIKEICARKQSTQHELEQFKCAVGKLKKDSAQVKAENDELHHRRNELCRHLQTLESSRSNHLRRFGAFMPQLVQKINQTDVFHKKPIGPLGVHFSLKDQCWALAVESCLRSLMHAFCVHDHHDEKELEKILKSVCFTGRVPVIITCPFQNKVYDVARYKPHTNQYPTVLEVLNIENPVVTNCLIDQRGIETVLLFHSSTESRNVMADHPPQGAREAFNQDGDQIFCHPFRYYSNNQDQVRILVQSVEQDIRQCRQELSSLDDKLSKNQETSRKINQQLQIQIQEEHKTQTQIMRLQEQSSKTQMELRELCDTEEPVPVDVKTLEEEVSILDSSLAKQHEHLAMKQGQYDKAKTELMECEKRFQKLDTDMSIISEQTDNIKYQLALAENAIQIAQNHKQHYDSKLKEHEKKISDLRTKCEEDNAELERQVDIAEKLCPRVKTKRSSQNLQSEIKQIGKQIIAEEKIRGNHEEVTKKYSEMKESYLSIRQEVSQLASFLKALQRVMANRERQYVIFRRMIAARTKVIFAVMLGTRRYSGKMIFDHRKESLEINILPSAVSKETCKDLRSLSGGERSFATVCFILSLWEAMESPFRCLDEFDVFMDMVNRRISMDMLMNVAQTQKARQFIFLTPQNISHINVDPSMVRIFQMQAPERGQSVLTFQSSEQSNGKLTCDDDNDDHYHDNDDETDEQTNQHLGGRLS